MARILFLVHRMPYPPNKGDKVRSYHLLRHLAARHEVLLGTFVDDPADEAHVETVRQWCADVKAVRLNPTLARLTSLAGLARGEPLTLAYYRDAGLRHWIDGLRDIDAVIVFSSSMVQYAEDRPWPLFVDFVDVDSAKWADYAKQRRWPLSWLYRREATRLLAYERHAATRAEKSFFVTDKEVDLFVGLAPECATKVIAVCNGVDTHYFAPDPGRTSPFPADEVSIVFTGAMDYWPNADAVVWFAQHVLPRLREQDPRVKLSVVGRNPAPAVQALAGPAVRVTGTVDDVRPWLQHATVVVAPLRLARGVQNKVLEAMAMARPVVAAAACVEAIDAEAGRDLLSAQQPEDFVAAIQLLLGSDSRAAAIGSRARTLVQDRYGWTARLSALDRCLEPLAGQFREVPAT